MTIRAEDEITLTRVNDGAQGPTGPQGPQGPAGADGDDGRMLYATCNTSADTAAKVATLTSGDLTLEAGATVAVSFTYSNEADNATLNIDSTGAKTIKAAGDNLTSDCEYNWTTLSTVIFIYDGTYWQMDGTAALDKANDALAAAEDAYEVGSADRNTFYAYASSLAGEGFSLNDTDLPYRGICITTDAEAPEEAGEYKWEINPQWASKHAEKYLHDVTGGLAIFSEDLGEDTYAGLSALALTFFLAGIQQMKVGYETSLQEYGVIAETLLAAGSGAGVKFDNTANASVRSRFVQEIRDNGHWSLKMY